MSSQKDFVELTKAAKDTLAELQTVASENTKLHTELARRDSLLQKQAQLLDAYAHVLTLVKEGEIDVGQVAEELDRIIKLGLSTYKEASVAPGAADRIFGEILPENSGGQVENQKTAHMLEDGRALDSVSAWLLQWREKRFGTPSGLVT